MSVRRWSWDDLEPRRPSTVDDVLALEAEMALLERRARFVCPLCGETREANTGHVGSADCLLRVMKCATTSQTR